MIVKLNYEGWQYFEGEEIGIKYGQSFLSSIDNDVICLIEDLPPKVNDDFSVIVIDVTNGSDVKRILIRSGDTINSPKNVSGYLLNNEGKTIDKI